MGPRARNTLPPYHKNRPGQTETDPARSLNRRKELSTFAGEVLLDAQE